MHESDLDGRLHCSPAIKRNRLDFPHPLGPFISKLDLFCKENVSERISTFSAMIFEGKHISTFRSAKT